MNCSVRLRRIAQLLAVCLLALAVTASCALGAAQTFGPDLSKFAPNNEVGCEVDPFVTSFVTNAPSCTWSSNVALGEDSTNPNGAQIPPAGDGTISQVSIKVGATTGPMQVVVLREELEFVEVGTPNVHAKVSCCDAIEQSQVFTPTADTTTSESVDLPVEVEETPNPQTGLLSADILGLSVLAQHVPVPAADERSLSVLDQPGTDAWEPAMTQGKQELADEQTGYLVLMDALWSPTGTAPAGGGPPANTPQTPAKTTTPTPTPIVNPAPPTPILSFPVGGALASIKHGHVAVTLGCGAGASCQGTVRLQSQPAGQAGAVARLAKRGGKKKHKRKPAVVTYASGNFDLAAGSSQAVAAKLSGSGKQLARRHEHRTVWINVTLTDTTPAQVSSHAVTLTF
ncbi:MAG TPA: hypothetical protein VMS02_08295 [Solirubrobacteraceae bacterium]|nr:hypothetical protein [Solirubrobacteraceae bacterium]